VEGTAEAIFQAITMPHHERRHRADALKRSVEADDVAKWFREQMWDLVRYAINGERDPGAILPSDEETKSTNGSSLPRTVGAHAANGDAE
jgi:trehalose-6-phosphate synthase